MKRKISEVITIVIVDVLVVHWVDDSVQSSSDSRTDGLTYGQRATRLEGEGRSLQKLLAKVLLITYLVSELRATRPITLLITLILRRSRTGTVWFYTSTSNKRAARSKLYTKSLTTDLKLMYSRFTLVRISIKL